MEAIVFSDSHGSMEPLDSALSHYKVEYVFGLGDYGVSPFDLEVRNVTGVRGNNYFDPDTFDYDMIYETEGFRILFTHGHKHLVGYGYLGLVDYCKKNNIDICFFGHTHQAEIEKYGDITLVNPGSIGYPMYPSYPTLVYLEMKDKKAKIEIVETVSFTIYKEIEIIKK